MTLVKQFLKELARSHSAKTITDYADRLERYTAWQAKRELPEHNKRNARMFLTYLQDQQFGKASIALHKATLSSFYSWLVESDHLEENPIRAMKFGRYRSPKKKDDCTFTPEEYTKLKDATVGHEYWHGAIIIGWNTGLRLGDVACLSFAQVDMPARKLTATPRKTRRYAKVVEVPITPELEEFIRGRPGAGIDFILPAMQIEYAAHGSKQLSQQFSRLCEKVGIEGKTFHSLRHTLTSRLLNGGVPLSMVASVTGHTLNVLQRYSHTRFEDTAPMIQEALR